MTKLYDDSRYGIEKIFCLGALVDLSGAGVSNVGGLYLTEDITITELGFMVEETISATSVCTVQMRIGGTVLATLNVLSTTAAGTVLRTATVTNLGDKDETLLFYRNITTVGTGSGAMYIKYRERYKSG